MLAFAITSCGGEKGGREAAPAIPRDVAEQLAAQSLDVAEALESGDACGAAELADSLRASAREAIERGEVPAPLGNELQRAVARLTREIACVPAGEEPAPGDDADPGQEDDGDGATTTSPTPDTTTTTGTTTTVEDTTTMLEETTTLEEG